MAGNADKKLQLSMQWQSKSEIKKKIEKSNIYILNKKDLVISINYILDMVAEDAEIIYNRIIGKKR